MARIILVTGGARSGKSDYAITRAEELPGPRLFIATCIPLDEEMKERVRRHQESRNAHEWTTIESPVKLADAIAGSGDQSVRVVDCLTLWISNLMLDAAADGQDLDEEAVIKECHRVISAAGDTMGSVFFVTNEVGLGIVPENRAARLFRDLVGRCNRIIAEGADEVVLVTCGIPIYVKGN